MKAKLINLAVFAIAFSFGFTVNCKWFSPRIVETEEVIRYVPSEVIIRDTVIEPEPHFTIIRDTVIRDMWDTIKVDTTRLFEIFQDYFAERGYNFDFSSDTIGTFLFDVWVSQNKISRHASYINPVIREREITHRIEYRRRFTPYAVIGIPTNVSGVSVQGGVILNRKWIGGIGFASIGDNSALTVNIGRSF